MLKKKTVKKKVSKKVKTPEVDTMPVAPALSPIAPSPRVVVSNLPVPADPVPSNGYGHSYQPDPDREPPNFVITEHPDICIGMNYEMAEILIRFIDRNNLEPTHDRRMHKLARLVDDKVRKWRNGD